MKTDRKKTEENMARDFMTQFGRELRYKAEPKATASFFVGDKETSMKTIREQIAAFLMNRTDVSNTHTYSDAVWERVFTAIKRQSA